MSVLEEWRPIPGFAGYEASSLGRIRSRWFRGGAHDRGRHLGPEWRILAGWVHKRYGYRLVSLVHEDHSKTRPVHQLVAEAFHGARPDSCVELRHLNGRKLDNRPENLQWGTQSENVLDRVRHGTHHNAGKSRCKRGHKFTPENTYVIPGSGSRVCRVCVRDSRQRQRPAASGMARAS